MAIHHHGGGFYTCLSTDAKPTGAANCVVLETDTGNRYKWANNTWTLAESAGSGPTVKSGLVNLTAGGSANVVFVTPFASTPHVVVTSQTNNADTSCTYSAHSVTVNGFTMRGAGNPAGNVAWLATNAGNS